MDTNCSDLELQSRPPHSDSYSASSRGAKYKLLSPATLPITRSPCITIPPGLSPSSFLESPVLLSNVKAETSPTTGSLIKPQAVHGSLGSISFPVANFSSNSFAEKKSSFFEFRPHIVTNMVPADLNLRKNDQSVQSQSFPSPRLVHYEKADTSSKLTLSSPHQMVTSGASAPAAFESPQPPETDNSNNHPDASQPDDRGNGPSVTSDDGYNWRKYGQKLVKGSEFPRSYYKCTHPNCEVKKLFERSPHDGRITEIIYKGTHDHPKPPPNRRYNGGAAITVPEERPGKVSSLPGQDDKSSDVTAQEPQTFDANGSSDMRLATASDGGLEAAEEDDEPYSKWRRMDTGGFDVTYGIKPIREPRVVVQTESEVDILDDGYRWRKYGQKVVRGNPNPRSYYKCTSVGCPVRKHVERASHNPKAVITTYEGKHNHDVPIARTSSHDTAGSVVMNASSRIRPDGNEPIRLDPGVGMSSMADYQSSDTQQAVFHPELVPSHPRTSGSAFAIDQATTIPAYYGVLHGGGSGMGPYESRRNSSDGHSADGQPVNHSSPYQNSLTMGGLLTGP